MGRTFAFSQPTARAARQRQAGRCAQCGCSLASAVEHAHHVIPNQSGEAGEAADHLLRSPENCVVLCDACHTAAHGHGKFRNGAVAPPEWFTYSHGRKGAAGHHPWCALLNAHWEVIATRTRERAP